MYLTFNKLSMLLLGKKNARPVKVGHFFCDIITRLPKMSPSTITIHPYPSLCKDGSSCVRWYG